MTTMTATTKTTTTTSTPNKTGTLNAELVGNWTYGLTIASTLVFACAVGKYANDDPGHPAIFDNKWIPDGFCVSGKDVPYWNSHDLCLYADVILAIMAGVLYLSLKSTPGMETANEFVKFNIFGIVGHGMAHGFIGKAVRDGTDQTPITDIMEGLSLVELVMKMSPLVIFWASLLKASMPNVSNIMVAGAAVPAFYFNTIVPPQFGFTYVQTVLLLAFSVNQLARPRAQKNEFAYALYPLVVSFPLTVVGWIESTQCSKFVMNMGGHLIYDAYIPISMMAFYVMCYNKVTASSKDKVKTT